MILSNAVDMRLAGAQVCAALQTSSQASFYGYGSTTISRALTGSISAYKYGSGVVTFSGSNSYTLGTFIIAGTLAIGHANGLGTTGNITFSGGTLRYATGITTDLSARIKNSASPVKVDVVNGHTVTFAGIMDATNTGGITKLGAGRLNLNTTPTLTGQYWFAEGLTVLGNGINQTDLRVDGVLDLYARSITIQTFSGVGEVKNSHPTATCSVTTAGSGSQVFNGIITGKISLTIGQAQQLQLTNTGQNFTGVLQIANAAFSTATLAGCGVGKINCSNGANYPTIAFTGAGIESLPTRDFDIYGFSTGGGIVIKNDGTGTITLGGAYTSYSAAVAKTLQLAGTNTTLNTMAGTIQNSKAGSGGTGNAGSTLSVLKAGTGTWNLSGTLLYTGATSISAGTLRRTFSSGSLSYLQFTPTALTAAFNATPVNGQTFTAFAGATTQTYASVSVTGAPGVVCAYDSPSSILRVVSGGSASQNVTEVQAGTSYARGDVDGVGTAARLYYPYGVAFDSSGTLWFTDSLNFKLKKMTVDTTVTTIAGSSQGAVDGTGSNAKFRSTDHLAVDSQGNIFVCDRLNHAIRKVTPNGVVTTFAGLMGSSGSADGTGTSARFNTPHGICIDLQDNLFVAEIGNNTIRKITPAGIVTTFAGTAGTSGSTDGTGTAIRFDGPYSVAVDLSGNLYVTDASSHYGGGGTNGGSTIRKITAGAVSSTLCGSPNTMGYVDASGSQARFNGAAGICVDAPGNIYVADRYNNAIRKITPAGVVSTFVGPNLGGYELNNPCGVAINSSGVLFIADTFGQVIRKKVV